MFIPSILCQGASFTVSEGAVRGFTVMAGGRLRVVSAV